MQPNRVGSLLILLPFLAALAILPGCEGGAVVDKGKRKLAGGDGAAADEVRVALAPKGFGTVSGKIQYDGQAPAPAVIAMGNNEAQCHATDKPQENASEVWLVDSKGGVKNAVVILQPPQGKYFEIPEAQRQPKDVVIDQPFCAFRPRIFVLFPSYYDGKEQQSTGQKLVIKNTATFSHNYNLSVDADAGSIGGSSVMPSGSEVFFDAKSLHPQAKPVTLSCNMHNWMKGAGFVLDHPYAAITKDDGTFVIENAPLGVELQVVAWHEGADFFNGGAKGKPMTLKDKEVLDLPKVKAR